MEIYDPRGSLKKKKQQLLQEQKKLLPSIPAAQENTG